MNKKGKKMIVLALSTLVMMTSLGCENKKNNEVKELEKVNGNYVVSLTNMSIGSKVSDGVKLRSTKELAMEDWKAIIKKDEQIRPFYLKHDFNENNEIKASYVEFIINDELKKEWKEASCENDSACEEIFDNLVNGIYTLKGGNNGESYESNKEIIKKAFNYEKQPDICHDGGPDFYCEVQNLYVFARGFGDVNVSSNNNACRISSDGISHCE